MTTRAVASPDAAVPLIEHIRAIADVLSLQGEHYDDVSSLITRLERELLPHALVGDGQLDSRNVHNAHDLSSSPLSLRIHAEIELQVLGLRALVKGLGSDVADVRELQGRLYGLGAAVRLHKSRADFEGLSTLPATASDRRPLFMMMSQDESNLIAEVTERLTRRFGAISSTTVDSTVAGIVHRFDGRPVRAFVPLLVERIAKSQLMSLDAA